MIIFNTTFHIDDDIHDACLEFLKQTYIVEAGASGFLMNPVFTKIYNQHEGEGTSYSLQFRVKNVDTLHYWHENYGALLDQKLAALYGTKALGFTTVMEEIDF